MFDLTGKVRVGDRRGTGRRRRDRTRSPLARARGRVVVKRPCGRPGKGARRPKLGPDAIAMPFDVTDHDAGRAAAIADLPAVDNPRQQRWQRGRRPRSTSRRSAITHSLRAWEPTIRVNLYGVLKLLFPLSSAGMCDRGWGRIIVISSGAALVGTKLGIAHLRRGQRGRAWRFIATSSPSRLRRTA